MFEVPNIYKGCNRPAEYCEAAGAEVEKAFTRGVDAPTNLTVTCLPNKQPDGLPDWAFSVEGYEFIRIMPSCFDPTYCDKDPPAPRIKGSVKYRKPSRNSMKFEDGESVKYQCVKDSKYIFKHRMLTVSHPRISCIFQSTFSKMNQFLKSNGPGIWR